MLALHVARTARTACATPVFRRAAHPWTGCAMLKMTFADMIAGKPATQGTAFVYGMMYLHTNLHQERVPTLCLLLGW